MRSSLRIIAAAFLKAYRASPEAEQEALIDAVISYLSRERFSRIEMRSFPGIVRKLLQEQEGFLPALVQTPSGQGGGELHALLTKLETLLGKKLVISQHADPHLLGGVVITVGDLRIDASLRGALSRMEQHLRHTLLPSSLS